MTTQLIFSIIFMCLSMGLLLWAGHIINKANNLHRKDVALYDEARRDIAEMQCKLNVVREENPAGYCISYDDRCVNVLALHGEISTVVKSFSFDDGIDYAVNEARYLYETLYEK